MSEFENFTSEDIEYILNLPYHLAVAGMTNELCELLTEFEFLEYKIQASTSQALIDDFDIALSSDIVDEKMKIVLELIASAVRLSANVVNTNKAQFAQQLWGRLISYKLPKIQRLLKSLKQKDTPWLRSLSPTLTQAGGRLLRTLTIDNGYANALLVTPNNIQIIAGLSDGAIRIWELNSGLIMISFIGHTEAVNSIAVTSNGKKIISGSADKTVRIWDLETNNEIFTLKGHETSVNAVAVTPDNKWIISGSDDGNIKIWDLKTGKENLFGGILFSISDYRSSITTLAINPDYQKHKKLVVSGSKDKIIKFSNIDTTGELEYESFELKGHSNTISSVVYSPDGKLIISGSLDKTIKVWNFATREEIFTLSGHTKEVNAVAISPDGKLVISGSSDKTIKVFNLDTRKELVSLAGHTDKVNSVVVASNGKQIISSSVDGTIKIWDLEKNANTFEPEIEEKHNESLSHSDSLDAITITPDGKQGISASVDGMIKVWNLETRKEILNLTGHNSAVKQLIVTSNSKYLIASSDNNTTKVWNLKTGKDILTLNVNGDGNHCLAVTSDSKYLIIITSEKILEIWNLTTQKLMTKFSGDSSLNSCAVASDGLTIMAGEASGQLHFLRLEGIDSI